MATFSPSINCALAVIKSYIAAICAVILLFPAAGCNPDNRQFASGELREHIGWPSADVAPDSARAVLSEADPALVDSAFHRLTQLSHERIVTTTQHDGARDTTAHSMRHFRRIIQNQSLSTEEIDREDRGTFDFGIVGRFADTGDPSYEEPESRQELIPEDPAYLAPRNFENYVYRHIPDTTFRGEHAYGAEVALRPGADDQPNERYAKAIFSVEDRELLYFSTLIVRETLLFDERTFLAWKATRYGADHNPVLPQETRVVTWMNMPLASAREISTRSVFRYLDPE